MKVTLPPILGLLGIALCVPAGARPKTITPEKVSASELKKEPYRLNGIVRSGGSRGSGFCAWNRKTFFSAAHVVFDGKKWAPPALWYRTPHTDQLGKMKPVRTRGYYRWTDYATYVDLGKNETAFGRDMIVGFSFAPLIPGKPATLNLNGMRDLSRPIVTTITGYPARNPYTGKPVAGTFLHQTRPAVTPYRILSGRSMFAQLITTGPGNSGGPVWMRGAGNRWTAAGVLVGGLPSETVVCPFSADSGWFLRAVSPLVLPKPASAIGVRGIDASSMFFTHARRHVIPDGVLKWSNFSVGVKTFLNETTVEGVKLSLRILTPHRGDLQIILSGPGGYEALIHNEEGANARNLVFNDRDLSESFSGIPANGTWTLRVQDRLKGDRALFESFRLEIIPSQENAAAP